MINLPQVVGLIGYARSGKDTVADYMVKEYGYTKISYASKLKELVAAIDPWVIHPVSGLTVRLSECFQEFGPENTKTEVPEYRRLLQVTGDNVRQILGDTVWVDGLFNTLDPSVRYVISDVRYPNEGDAVLDRGHEVWRIHRKDVGPLNDHPSEVLLDTILPDFAIYNNSSVASLFDTVDTLLTGV